MENMLDNLIDNDPFVRSEAADKLRDRFEFKDLAKDEFYYSVKFLVERIPQEKDSIALESIFNAILEAVNSQNVSALDIPWDKLISKLPELNSVYLSEYALPILGFIKRKEFESVIIKYLNHEDVSVRESANLALAEIRHNM